MKKQHSRIGLVSSLLIHGAVLGGGFFWLNNHKVEKAEEQQALSMEMVAALLEQPPVAVSPEPEEAKEEEKAEPELPPEPEADPEPVVKPKPPEPKKPEKPKEPHKPKKEKPKEKPPEKPKEKPIEKPKTEPIKALERGIEAKQGIVAKAVPNAAEGSKVVAGVAGGQKNGAQNATASGNNAAGGGNADEIAAYKAALQKALQRRANSAYPTREKMMRKMGTVTIKFTVAPNGQITNVSVISSSGNDNLDNAAMSSAQGLSMPPPPAGLPTITVPVKFSIE